MSKMINKVWERLQSLLDLWERLQSRLDLWERLQSRLCKATILTTLLILPALSASAAELPDSGTAKHMGVATCAASQCHGSAVPRDATGFGKFCGVDETGGQIAVFGRKGSRPLNLEEMQKLYLDDQGNPWYVQDDK